MDAKVSIANGLAQATYLALANVFAWRKTSPKLVFFLANRTPACHPDPQAAVFRSLRRRDLLLNRGIVHGHEYEERYAVSSLSVPGGPYRVHRGRWMVSGGWP